MNDLISIIVPAFNIAKDLRQCVESILAQTYANWELILINDASYDQTGELCREFESKDERIKLIELATQHGVATIRKENFIKERPLIQFTTCCHNPVFANTLQDFFS